MNAVEIIRSHGSEDIEEYSKSEIKIIKEYGWKEYGFGVMDTIRAELMTEADEIAAYTALLDHTFC